jgi:pimeloyl-ACP methyl ester carboxylesterase
MVHRAILSLGLSAALAVSPFVERGQAQVPLAVRISGLQMIAPGRVGVDVTITGLQPELHPTIEGAATVGGQMIPGREGPAFAARLPAAIDLRRGRVLIGGDASMEEFAPVPPLEENTPIAVEVTVRQGSAVAAVQQKGVLLLPTIIVPGYLNDMSRRPDSSVLSVLERRGYRATGASPDLFWFSYTRDLGLEEAARALAVYVREVVLPQTYAARINVVGYSLGGLVARWNLAFERGWNQLVNRFVMVGVPNEGTVMSYVYRWYPLAAPWARTPAAQAMLPAFPFWRPTPAAPWGFPEDARDPILATLNTHPLPEGIRAYAFYAHYRDTWAGLTGALPTSVISSGPGDGIVLAASALGLPINGGAGVPGLADRLLMKVDLGAVAHASLLSAAVAQISDLLSGTVAAGKSSPTTNRPRRARVMYETVLDGLPRGGAIGGFLKTR